MLFLFQLQLVKHLIAQYDYRDVQWRSALVINCVDFSLLFDEHFNIFELATDHRKVQWRCIDLSLSINVKIKSPIILLLKHVQ